jgi:hypothetical protein
MVFARQFSSKKSQITVFIIIGLLLLAGAGVFFALRSQTNQISGVEESISQVPLQVKPVSNFVEGCIQSVGIEAVKKMGQHGGYTDPLEEGLTGNTLLFDSKNPTESDGLTITDDPATSVVYYWYLKGPNTCLNCLLSNALKPTDAFLEEQINEYLRKNIDSCLDGFKGFSEERFNVVKLKNLTAKATITQKDIFIVVDFPLRVNVGEETTDLRDFSARIPIDLRKTLLVARHVSDAEALNNFLEYAGKMLIAYNSGLDTAKLPPVYGRETSFMPRIWMKVIVEEQIEDLLMSYITLFQINGTKDASLIKGADAFSSGIYRSFYLPSLNGSFENYSVRFYYLGWPIYLHITPDSGGIYEASRVTEIERSLLGFPSVIPVVPTREYEFYYDLSFPVLVEIRNKNDLYGEGFTWLFALEANIRDNRGMRQWFEGNGTWGPWKYELYGVEPMSEVKNSDEAKKIPALAVNMTKSLFCNPNQRISGNISIIVTDLENETDELEGVSVSYACGKYAGCPMGITGFNSNFNRSLLFTRFPACIGGGILTLKKSGYDTKIVTDLTTLPDENLEIEASMQKIYAKEAKVEKILFNRNIIYRSGAKSDFAKNYVRELVPSTLTASPDLNKDGIIISLRRIDASPLIPSTAQNIIFSKDKPDPVLRNFTLVPGVYEIRTTFINLQGVKIVPEYRCHDDDEDCFWIPQPPGVKTDQYMGGGLNLVNETGYWVVTPSQLKKGNAVTFKILELPVPMYVEDMGDVGKVDDTVLKYRYLFEPVFG